jgi:hypothetical protein
MPAAVAVVTQAVVIQMVVQCFNDGFLLPMHILIREVNTPTLIKI